MSSTARSLAVAGACAVALIAVLANCAYQWQSAAGSGWSGMDLRVNTQITSRGSRAETFLSVEAVDPLSPASRAGLQAHDKIVGLNGSNGTMATRFRQLRPGDSARITVERGRQFQTTITLGSPWSYQRVIWRMVFDALTGSLALAIGVFVFIKRRADPSATVLLVLITLYAILRYSGLGPVHRYALEPQANLLTVILFIIAGVMFAPVLLHFCSTFPRPRAWANAERLRALYTLPALAAAAILAFVIVFVVLVPVESQALSDALAVLQRDPSALENLGKPLLLGLAAASLLAILRAARLVRTRGFRGLWAHPASAIMAVAALPFVCAAVLGLLWPVTAHRAPILLVAAGLLLLLAGTGVTLALVYPIAACVAFWRTYRESSGDQKRQLRWPVLGLVLGVSGWLFAGPILWIIGKLSGATEQNVLGLAIYEAYKAVPAGALLLIPLSIAFAIFKYRLLDIDVYIRKTIIYGVLSVLLAILYTGIVGGVGGFLAGVVPQRSNWVPIAATAVVSALVLPVRSRIQAHVDKRLYRTRDYSSALARLTATAASSDDPGAILQTALYEVRDAIPSRAVALWVKSAEYPVFELRQSAPGVEERAAARVPLDSNLVRRLSEGSTIAAETLPDADAAPLRAVRADIILPIHRRSELRAFVSIGPKLSDTAWDADDLGFLQAASGQIAIALDSAGSAAERADMQHARDIQVALMPAEIPQPPGTSLSGVWQPARSIGGDYYDVLRLSDTKYGLVIADVSGKGLPAALLMSNVQAGMKFLANPSSTPAEVCIRLNESLCRHMTPGRFVTLAYAVLDETNRIVYANAGHNPPLLVRYSGQVERLVAGGPPLGLFAIARYDQGDFVLEPGDKLILYTDGLSDATNSDGEEFGEDRIVECVRSNLNAGAEEMKEALVAAVTRHCGGVFSDDLTVVALAISAARQARA